MKTKDINIEFEYEHMLETLRKLNSEETIRVHTRSMKIAFVFGLARAVNLTEKFEDMTQDESEDVKDSVDQQVTEFFDDLEQGAYIEEVMNDIYAQKERNNNIVNTVIGTIFFLLLAAYGLYALYKISFQ